MRRRTSRWCRRSGQPRGARQPGPRHTGQAFGGRSQSAGQRAPLHPVAAWSRSRPLRLRSGRLLDPQPTPEIWTGSVPSTSSGSHRLRPALPGPPAGSAPYSRDKGAVAPASPWPPAGSAASQRYGQQHIPAPALLGQRAPTAAKAQVAAATSNLAAPPLGQELPEGFPALEPGTQGAEGSAADRTEGESGLATVGSWPTPHAQPLRSACQEGR